MDVFEDGGMFPGFELKPKAGFGKEGYKNFDGCITQLQMQTYLIIRKLEPSQEQARSELRHGSIPLPEAGGTLGL